MVLYTILLTKILIHYLTIEKYMQIFVGTTAFL